MQSKPQETAKLITISNMFDIPLWTLRKLASARKFPGIIKKGRSLYVDIQQFREWWYKDEIKIDKNDDGKGEAN